MSAGSESLPADRSEANALLCRAAGAGDAQRLAALLAQGLSADGYWDPARAMAMHQQLMKEVAAIPMPEDDDLPEGIRITAADVAAVMEEQTPAGPYATEIPLFCAATSGSAECVRILLEAGARADRRDDSQRTAMHYAANTEVIRILQHAGLSIADQDEHEWSPLVEALCESEANLGRIRALIECGADVNATHDRGYTVFMSAVGSGRHPEALRLLVEAGADPHAVSDLGYNAFHAAIDINGEANAEESVRETLSYLKELGVDIDGRTNGGQTPLARALEVGTAIEFRVLCELGADVNAICPMHQCRSDGCERVDRPLLLTAALGPNFEIDEKIDAMLRAGADPLVHDADGFTPLAHAVARLCSGAQDYDAAYVAFLDGFERVQSAWQSLPADRGAYVSAVTPSIRRFVEEFAAAIPLPRRSGYASSCRAELVNSIILLAAHESWARSRQQEQPRR